MTSTPKKERTLVILQDLFGALSLLGCCFVIFVIWLYQKYTSYVQRLILCLSISAAIHSISYLIRDYTEGGVCVLQGFLMQFTGWAILMWICCISLHMMMILRNVQSPDRFEKYFHIASWSMSIFWSVWPFFFNKYASAGIWCWISREATALRFGVWYIPIYSITIALLVLYIYIVYTAVKQKRQWTGELSQLEQDRRNELMFQVKPLVAYPLIYIFLNIPSLILRIDDAHSGVDQYPNFWLYLLTVICSPSIGAAIAIAFALDRATLAYLKPSKMFSTLKNRLTGGGNTRITHDYEVQDTHEAGAVSSPQSNYGSEVEKDTVFLT